MRQSRRFDLIDTVRTESQRAVRALARQPGFTLIAVLTLALGIGAATAIFTVLDAVVLRPLPYRDSQELVSVLHPATVPGSGERRWGLSTGGYFHFKENTKTLQSFGMYRTYSVTVTGDGPAEVAQAGVITPSMFEVFGARAAHGRLFTEQDGIPGGPLIVVLGYEYWQRRFGGDRSVIGTRLTTSDGSREIVGIAQPGLTLPMPGPFANTRAMSGEAMDLWLPMRLNRAGPHWNSHPNVGVGRLAPGRTVAEAQAEITLLTSQLPDVVPNAYNASFMREYNFRGEAAPLKDSVLGTTLPRTMWMLFGAVTLVLLIAAANVAGLFIVRHESRRRESAVRVALGADRRHMAAHYLAESLVLCVAAAVLGVWLSFAGLRLLLAIAPPEIPRLATVGMGWGTIAFAAVAALVCGLLFGLPALSRSLKSGVLRENGRTQTASHTRQSARDVMLVGQLSLAVILMAAAGLMIRSLSELRSVRPGFDHTNVLAFDVSLPFPEYDTREKALAFHRQLQERIAALPGVENIGSVTGVPLEGYGTGCTVVWREGLPYEPGTQPPCVSTPVATPGFFETLRIPVRGRIPSWEDVDGRTQAVVVTQALADRLWPGKDPVGQGINSNGSRSTTWYKVVGVVSELRAEALDQPATEAVFYAPTGFTPDQRSDAVNYFTYLVRARDPQALVAPTRRLLAEMNSRIPYVNPRTMDHVFAQSTARTSFVMLLLGIAAAVALALSAVGTYGVVSYVVTQRKPEIGVRIALGASMREVSGMVLAQSLRRAALGAVIGLVGAWATTRLLARLLYGVSPTDPVVLISVALGLVCVAALAAYAPARRAARVDPVEVLRSG